ncbi:FAD-binding oxidoreductase [Kiloniella sp. EL199]|uniref:NAD(P)/FAD-dependent oxidoreductase n=1 Tax=Kiloniella sp. EL199 TaxID=2107581 RepID=UPI000EA0CB5C|nr:FAD-binding oxidoreductase [Kiloniella sp. EL199]
MTKTSDVVIVGGGIIGSAAAFFLASDTTFNGKITVIEKDNSYQGSSTTLSAASIRQQFSTPENINISLFGIEFLRNLSEHLSLDDEKQSALDLDIGLQEKGYLLLASDKGRETLQNNNWIQKELGADISLLTPALLKKRFPWMNCDDIALGSLGLSGEGWFDAYSLLQLFRAKNKELGVIYKDGEITGFEKSSGRIVAAELKGPESITGEKISGEHFINAAGPMASRIAGMAGIDIPIESRKRCVFVFNCREEIPNSPLVVDTNGVYFRPEGEHFICGTSPLDGYDPECFDYDVDYNLFDEHIWPTLANRVTAFESIKQVNAWAGHYAYNLLDQNVILGTHPDVGNLYFANGFSGHGLQQAPAVGRALSELIVYGKYRTLDLSIFGMERIINKTPVKELNVI